MNGDWPTAVESLPAALPTAYALAQSFPNPFNPSTTIRFSLPTAAVVTLTVYDVQGQKVATLTCIAFCLAEAGPVRYPQFQP
jgi:hypothetical protein